MSSNVNYLEKYLKYKNKYLELKKQIAGTRCNWNTKKEPQHTKCKKTCTPEEKKDRGCFEENKVYAGPTGCDYICKNNSWKFLDKPTVDPKNVGDVGSVNGATFTAARMLGIGPLQWKKD